MNLEIVSIDDKVQYDISNALFFDEELIKKLPKYEELVKHHRESASVIKQISEQNLMSNTSGYYYLPYFMSEYSDPNTGTTSLICLAGNGGYTPHMIRITEYSKQLLPTIRSIPKENMFLHLYDYYTSSRVRIIDTRGRGSNPVYENKINSINHKFPVGQLMEHRDLSQGESVHTCRDPKQLYIDALTSVVRSLKSNKVICNLSVCIDTKNMDCLENTWIFDIFYNMLHDVLRPANISNTDVLKELPGLQNATSLLEYDTTLNYGFKIVDVIEKEYRRSVFSYNIKDPVGAPNEINVQCTNIQVEHEAYNHMDVGNLIVFKTSYSGGDLKPKSFTEFQRAYELVCVFEVMCIIDAKCVFPLGKEFSRFKRDRANRSTTTNVLFSSQQIESIRLQQEIERMAANRTVPETSKRELIKHSMIDNINVIMGKGDDYILNGITYNTNKVSYVGQELTMVYSADGRDLNWLSWVGAKIHNNIDPDSINWDSAYSYYFRWLHEKIFWLKANDDSYISCVIGTIPITIIKGHKTMEHLTSGYVGSSFWYINGIRINYEELLEVTKKALCCLTSEDYAAMLKSVSRHSLKISKYISDGLTFSLKITKTAIVKVRLKLTVANGSIFLKTAKHNYKVKKIHDLARITDKTTIENMLKVLRNENIIDVPESAINSIILDGKKEYVDFMAKSKKLVESACKATGAKLETVNIGPTPMTGYVVQGTNDKYLILPDPNSPTVYGITTGAHYCIIDKQSNNQAGMDTVVNRIFALKNDSMVASYIYTLKQN